MEQTNRETPYQAVLSGPAQFGQTYLSQYIALYGITFQGILLFFRPVPLTKGNVEVLRMGKI